MTSDTESRRPLPEVDAQSVASAGFIGKQTPESIRALVDQVAFPGYSFHVVSLMDGAVMYLQASFLAPCARTGKVEEQRTRKWLLSQHMTVSEIVQTALKVVLTSVEHEAREQFLFRGEPVFGPHLDVLQTWGLCRLGGVLDAREPQA